jgi:hypothetical protein
MEKDTQYSGFPGESTAREAAVSSFFAMSNNFTMDNIEL